MKIEGEITLPASAENIWDMLQDPDFLACVMPGCKKMSPIGDDQYQGILEAKVGPISSQYITRFSIHDKNPPHSYRLHLEGKGKGGFVRAETNVTLISQENETVMHYSGEATIGGTITRVGQRLVETAAKMLINRGFESMRAKVEERLKE